jgi:DNA-binding XRE family transcriptional regulator
MTSALLIGKVSLPVSRVYFHLDNKSVWPYCHHQPTPRGTKGTNVDYELARRTRRYKDLTQAQVAATVGVGEATLSRWESGDREPRATELKLWARALGLTVDELLGEAAPRKAEVTP